MAHINLETETRGTVDTATAAHYLNYSKQTLLRWASEGSGPIQPHRVEGARKLQWRMLTFANWLGMQHERHLHPNRWPSHYQKQARPHAIQPCDHLAKN